MEREEVLKLLKKKDQSVEKPTEQNPYSQTDLSKFIDDAGYEVEQTPKLSELAKLLNKQNNPLDLKQELNEQDKNPISTVRKHISEKDEIDEPNKQLSIQALKRLIAKYKGENNG